MAPYTSSRFVPASSANSTKTRTVGKAAVRAKLTAAKPAGLASILMWYIMKERGRSGGGKREREKPRRLEDRCSTASAVSACLRSCWLRRSLAAKPPAHQSSNRPTGATQHHTLILLEMTPLIFDICTGKRKTMRSRAAKRTNLADRE